MGRLLFTALPYCAGIVHWQLWLHQRMILQSPSSYAREVYDLRALPCSCSCLEGIYQWRRTAPLRATLVM